MAYSPLTFHRRCGGNVRVIEDGMKVEKTGELLLGFGGALTARPLRTEEALTVRLGANPLLHFGVTTHSSGYGGALTALTARPLRTEETFTLNISGRPLLYFGVTTHSPETMEFPLLMSRLQGTWCLLCGAEGWVYVNGKVVNKQFLSKAALDALKWGGTLGLMVTKDRNLVFYVNGTSVGVAATDIPNEIYGFVDLWSLSSQAVKLIPDVQEKQSAPSAVLPVVPAQEIRAESSRHLEKMPTLRDYLASLDEREVRQPFCQREGEHHRLQQELERQQEGLLELLQESEREKDGLRQQLQQREREQAGLRQQLQQREREQAGLRQQLQQREREQDELRQQREREQQQLRQQLQDRNRDLVQLQEQLENMRSSHHRELQHAQTQLQAESQQLRAANATIAQLQQQLASSQGPRAAQQTHHTEFWEVPRGDVTLNMQRILGTGGWGYVVEGKFRGQAVAVKCLHDLIREPVFVAVIRREIGIMAQVRHPNLVLLIAAVIDEEDPLIITELLDLSLRRAYERNRLDPGERCKLSIFRDVASALNYLHLHHHGPIIHRDVSSANVLLESRPRGQWRAKLSDFGSAKLAREATTTGPGAAVYSAPEVRRDTGIRQSPKVDVYSYGVMVCEVGVGQFPMEGRFPAMMQSLSQRGPLLHRLVSSCTQECPDDRPSMAAILADLDRALGTGTDR